jgi:hypothetical protein
MVMVVLLLEVRLLLTLIPWLLLVGSMVAVLLCKAHACCPLCCREPVHQPLLHVVQHHAGDQACHLSIVDLIHLQGQE